MKKEKQWQQGETEQNRKHRNGVTRKKINKYKEKLFFLLLLLSQEKSRAGERGRATYVYDEEDTVEGRRRRRRGTHACRLSSLSVRIKSVKMFPFLSRPTRTTTTTKMRKKRKSRRRMKNGDIFIARE